MSSSWARDKARRPADATKIQFRTAWAAGVASAWRARPSRHSGRPAAHRAGYGKRARSRARGASQRPRSRSSPRRRPRRRARVRSRSCFDDLRARGDRSGCELARCVRQRDTRRTCGSVDRWQAVAPKFTHHWSEEGLCLVSPVRSSCSRGSAETGAKGRSVSTWDLGSAAPQHSSTSVGRLGNLGNTRHFPASDAERLDAPRPNLRDGLLASANEPTKIFGTKTGRGFFLHFSCALRVVGLGTRGSLLLREALRKASSRLKGLECGSRGATRFAGH